jgi:hypothetical protein
MGHGGGGGGVGLIHADWLMTTYYIHIYYPVNVSNYELWLRGDVNCIATSPVPSCLTVFRQTMFKDHQPVPEKTFHDDILFSTFFE